jgi:hypothetical protein
VARSRSRFGLAYLTLALVTCATAVLFVALTHSGGDTAEAATPTTYTKADATAAPTAGDFATTFAGTANAYSKAHGSPSRIARVHCVQASRGHYMCSYAVVRPRRAQACHLMQARWTPGRASSYEVTLSGRADRCGSLREAIASLD